VPTYQYACTACEHRFDAVQSFSDDALTECPECGGRLRKLYGAVGVVFKGSGFYRTDSRSEPKPSATPAEKADKKSDTKVADGATPAKPATDSKPAATSGSKTATSTSGSAA
jgi:putative FmdB family regulatory protein